MSGFQCTLYDLLPEQMTGSLVKRTVYLLPANLFGSGLMMKSGRQQLLYTPLFLRNFSFSSQFSFNFIFVRRVILSLLFFVLSSHKLVDGFDDTFCSEVYIPPPFFRIDQIDIPL